MGKGNKNSLKQVRKVNDKGQVEEILQDRKSIEEAIVQHNVMHFRQGFDSKAYKDRIYEKLQIDQIRDKILQGELDISECDDNDIYSFLKLLKRQHRDSECSIPTEISEEE